MSLRSLFHKQAIVITFLIEDLYLHLDLPKENTDFVLKRSFPGSSSRHFGNMDDVLMSHIPSMGLQAPKLKHPCPTCQNTLLTAGCSVYRWVNGAPAVNETFDWLCSTP